MIARGVGRALHIAPRQFRLDRMHHIGFFGAIHRKIAILAVTHAPEAIQRLLLRVFFSHGSAAGQRFILLDHTQGQGAGVFQIVAAFLKTNAACLESTVKRKEK